MSDILEVLKSYVDLAFQNRTPEHREEYLRMAVYAKKQVSVDIPPVYSGRLGPHGGDVSAQIYSAILELSPYRCWREMTDLQEAQGVPRFMREFSTPHYDRMVARRIIWC